MELCTLNLPQHSFLPTTARKPSLHHSSTSCTFNRTTISRRNPGSRFSTKLKVKDSEENIANMFKQFGEALDGASDEGKAAEGEEESNTSEQWQPFEFLDRLGEKPDIEGIYPVLIYGSATVVSLWLASAVLGAIDSLPLVPKLLELVGLTFTTWFTSRYLLFKSNRKELSAKVEELKQQIIGFPEEE